MAMPNAKDVIESVLKWVDDHFSLRYFSMLFVLCIAFLFGINPILTYLGLPPVPQVYRVVAAVGVLLFGVGSIFFSLEAGLKKWREWWKRHRKMMEIRDYLYNLPIDQGRIIQEYCRTKKSSLSFQPSDGAVHDLANRGILYRPTRVGHLSEGWAFSLTKQALVYFQKPEFQKKLLNTKFD